MNMLHPFAAALAVLQPFALASDQPTVDGVFDDWNRSHIVAVDPAGDSTGAFDVTVLQAQTQGTVVYLRFDTGKTLNIQSGPGEEGTLNFRFKSEDSERELEIDVRARSVELTDEQGQQSDIGWHAADYRSAPTYASPEFEIRVDLSVLGAQAGDEILLTVDGSDSLDEPVRLTLADAQLSQDLPQLDMERVEGTILRAASLNTLRNGIVDTERSAALLRLLKASEPDVVLLQEEYNTSAEDVVQALERGLGGRWNIVKVRDNVIATRYPLSKLQSLDDCYAAGIIDTPTHGPALLFSVHPKCCGTIGSEEDQRRIRQTRAMIQTIELARARYGEDLPILLAGDWNLVGSRSPLDLLTNPVGPALRKVDIRHAGSREVYTWFAPESSFGPGVLDLATVDAAHWERSKGFLLDTRTIDPASLDTHGLRPSDSASTDHLLMVIDLVSLKSTSP